MPDRAVIETEYPSLREIADRYGVSAKKLRKLLARFASVVQDGASRKPRLGRNPQTGEPTPSRASKKKRIRLQVAAKRRGTKSRRQKGASSPRRAGNPAVV